MAKIKTSDLTYTEMKIFSGIRSAVSKYNEYKEFTEQVNNKELIALMDKICGVVD